MWTLGRRILLALALCRLQAASTARATADVPPTGEVPTPTAAGGDSATKSTTRLDHAFFLKQIFDKYGHGGIMTFEGFEHLLESLGLGRLAFERRHEVALHRAEDGSFREVHDALRLHLHAHPEASVLAPEDPASTAPVPLAPTREALPRPQALRSDDGFRSQDSRQRCLSAREMLVGFGLPGSHGVAIDANNFLHMCPVIVYELDQRTCYHANEASVPQRRGQYPAAWRLAALSVLVASSVGLVVTAAGGLLLGSSRRALPALDLLVAIGAGTLCGDALLHLLPHVFSSSHDGSKDPDGSHGHSQEPVLRAFATFFTIGALFGLEVLLRRRSARQESGAPSDATDRAEEQGRTWEVAALEDGASVNDAGAVVGASPAAALKGHSQSGGGGADAGVLMVLLGDGLHNVTDGLAVGAAFCDDPVAGFATALAVFCHELPHEFGDFAALLKSGMSLRRALLYNLLSSGLSFLGMAVGLWVGNLNAASQWIYAVTAGSFLYIALVDLIPDLSRNTNQSMTITSSCLQLLGLLLGGGIMLVIALYEDVLRTLFE